MSRAFMASPAVRKAVPLLIGLVGPSGGGKTMSALRLATGMARVSGGRVKFIDTEADRALHYADRFDFDHIPFAAPFSPADYLDVIEYAHRLGPGPIIVDSMSHEHEGPGGVLEMHETELERLGGGEKNNWRAWSLPKLQRQRLINSILQMRTHFVFCFRAKPKKKPIKGSKELLDLGWQAIAGDNFIFEMTAKFLLRSMADGRPDARPELEAEREMVKLPEFLRPMFVESRQFDEATGEELAKWAAGGAAPAAKSVPRPSPATWKMLRDHLEKAGLSKREMREWCENTLSRPVEDPEALSPDDRAILAANLPHPGA